MNKKTHLATEKNFALHHSLKINKRGVLTRPRRSEKNEKLISVTLCITAYCKHFIKAIYGAFRNNITINLLTRSGWASLCEITGGFQLLVQNKLFPSLGCHFFYNALQILYRKRVNPIYLRSGDNRFSLFVIIMDSAKFNIRILYSNAIFQNA